MARPSKLHRFFRHLATDHGSVRRAFPEAALARIEALIAEGEKRHRGQVRFSVEASLPLARVLAGVTPRERAIEVFSLLRIWDTEENCGVLVYLLLADRDVEIVADRGIHERVGTRTWERRLPQDGNGVSRRRFVEGVETGLAEINALLAEHYPRGGAGGRQRASGPTRRPLAR